MSRDARAVTFIMFSLIAVGLVMTYSASAIYSDQIYGSATYFFRRQLFYLLLGSIFFGLAISIDPSDLQDRSRRLVLVAIFFLVMVFFPVIGHSAGGARRWIGLGLFNFQPVEFTKLAVCIFMSDYLSRKLKPIAEGSVSALLPPLVILGVILILLISQPDLGSCIFLLLISGILFFLAGIKLRYVAIALVPVILGLVVLIIKAPYRINRVVAFLNPWGDPAGTGFQIIQSFIAFSLGGINGVGLGQSTQKLFYLPQSYTDFIFSIIGEELGLLGTLGVLILYGSFFHVGLRISSKSKDPFLRLLSYALTLIVVLQALINILVTTGLIPTKGLPLPFVSYGGTSLIFNMMTVGLLVAVDRKATSRQAVRF